METTNAGRAHGWFSMRRLAVSGAILAAMVGGAMVPTAAYAGQAAPTGAGSPSAKGASAGATQSKTGQLSVTLQAPGASSPDKGAGVTPELTPGGTTVVCTFTASESYQGNGANFATGEVYCPVPMDAIAFRFAWFRSGTATLLSSSFPTPSFNAMFVGKSDVYNSFELLDVSVCATVILGNGSGSGCIFFYGV